MVSSPATDYTRKPAAYFEGAREDYVDALPDDPDAAILEIGCGYGGTGALALERGRCRRYVGVDIDPAAAEIARGRLTEVLAGNAEEIELPFAEGSFDALIMSEVLEHLADPWSLLSRLAPLVRPGGLVLASSPNISHYSVIWSLVQGRWELTDMGVMDRTHLRWFTPALYAELFEQAGFEVEEVAPVVPFSRRTRFLNRLSGGRYSHLFMRQISLRGRRRARLPVRDGSPTAGGPEGPGGGN